MLNAELDLGVWEASVDLGVVILRWVLLSASCGMMVLILDRWRRGCCGHLVGALALVFVVGGTGSLVYMMWVGEPWWMTGLHALGWQDRLPEWVLERTPEEVEASLRAYGEQLLFERGRYVLPPACDVAALFDAPDGIGRCLAEMGR